MPSKLEEAHGKDTTLSFWLAWFLTVAVLFAVAVYFMRDKKTEEPKSRRIEPVKEIRLVDFSAGADKGKTSILTEAGNQLANGSVTGDSPSIKVKVPYGTEDGKFPVFNKL